MHPKASAADSDYFATSDKVVVNIVHSSGNVIWCDTPSSLRDWLTLIADYMKCHGQKCSYIERSKQSH